MLAADKERALANLVDRVEAIKERVSIADVLDALGVDYTKSKGKIHCLYPDHVERTGSMKVYEKTNSAYCFGCGRSADIIEIVRLCGSTTDGQRASLGQIVRWFEGNFGIAGGSSRQNLNERVDRRLAPWRKTRHPQALSKNAAILQVLTYRDTLLSDLPKEALLALAPIEDRLWDRLESPDLQPENWVACALNVLRGSYADKIKLLRAENDSSLRSLRSSSREPDFSL